MGEAAVSIDDHCIDQTVYSFASRSGGMFLAKESKRGALVQTDANGLGNFPFLAINQRSFAVVHVEVDDVAVDAGCIIEPAFDVETFYSLDIPPPNYSVMSSGHRFHAFWLLGRSLPKAASYASLAFYHDVRAKLVHSLGGDRCCNIAGAVRNPFFHGAKARQLATRPYSLSELNMPGVKVDARAFAAFRATYAPGSRNTALFNALLRFQKDSGGAATAADMEAQAGTFMALHPDVPALPMTEVRSIVSSLVRNGARYGTRAVRRYGAMNLGTVDYSALERDERLAVIRDRQSQGARFVNDMQRAAMLAKLSAAADELAREGVRATQAAVAARAGVSLRSVKTYGAALRGSS